jgi:ureidoacrylate peracid hydrolase
MMDFRTVMVADASAAMSDTLHNASLVSFYQFFGDVMTVDHVIERLDARRLSGVE